MHKDLVIEQDHRGKKVKIVEDPKLVEPGYLDPKLKWAKSRMHWWLSKVCAQ